MERESGEGASVAAAEPPLGWGAAAMSDTQLICDFCSAPDPAWRYPARTFLAYCAPNVAGESVGDWAACNVCHKLIEAEDTRGLAQRSLDELLAKFPETRSAAAVFYAKLAELHRQFFAHRVGAPVRIGANVA
jgi:hypothetical protein